MGLLSNLLFGPSEPKNTKKKAGVNPFDQNYDDYYGDLHDDAISGDLDAQAEMREEFGDDWEGEY